MTQTPRALVLGAGIGGLAAAGALERAGFHVLVFERAPSVRGSGFGLLLAANAVHALRMLRVADAVIAQSEVAAEGELRAAGGRVLKRVRLEAIRKITGEDAICALRPVVHAALRAALSETEVRTGVRAIGFAHSQGGVQLELEGGERVEGSLLVAADGLHSIVREALHHDALRESGLIAYRGVCRGTTWPVTGCQYFGRGMEAGVARTGGDAIYWYLSVKSKDAHAELEPRPAAFAIAQRIDRALASLVERTEPDAVHRDTLCDRAPLTRWGEGSVTLLGDSAHPMLPHAGQGAAQALEDAVVLGNCLARASDIEAGLRRYEQIRIPRTSRIVTLARRNARVGRIENARLCSVRDWLLEHGPASLIEKQLVSMARVNLDAI